VPGASELQSPQPLRAQEPHALLVDDYVQQAFQNYGVSGNSNHLLDQLRQIDSIISPMDYQQLGQDFEMDTHVTPLPSELPWSTTPISVEPPIPDRTPTPEHLDSYPRVQFRVGKKDWEMLIRLSKSLNTLQSDVRAFNEFLHRKQHPETMDRIDLDKINQQDLRHMFDAIEDGSVETIRHNHTILREPFPRGISDNNTGRRPHVWVRYAESNESICFAATAVILYYKPTKCFTTGADGKFCLKRHRTVYEFCEEHPQFRPTEVHISHLCHSPTCLNWRHLIFEHSSVNLRRNTCRRDCCCGGSPNCYKDQN